MPWARFSADFDYHPPGASWTVAYKASMRCEIKADCLAAARSLGAAKPIKPPPQDHRVKLRSDPHWTEGADAVSRKAT